uniref:LPS responsive beige-like anchor protein n=1 Tax=Apteryx owenii TaxID=8824 RepID=A0A8B9P7S4_APTOW
MYVINFFALSLPQPWSPIQGTFKFKAESDLFLAEHHKLLLYDGKLSSSIAFISTLLAFIMELLKNSIAMQEQMLSCKGFLVIGYSLEKSSKAHVTRAVLELCLAFSKYLSNLHNGVPLLKQLCDHVLLNPAIWIHIPAKVQLILYTYLSTEFIGTVNIYNAVRRVGTVLLVMHTLKYYYWVVNPQDRSGITPKGLDGPRPNQKEILSLRAFLLMFIKQLVMKDYGIKEDELQAILNYLLTIHEDDNLMDVLQLLVALMSEHPSSMIPAFDKRNGLRVVYKLLASRSEGIRVQALKVMGYFLKHLAPKRKAEVMLGHGLFSLLAERLMLQTSLITMTTYNVLFEILTEQICTQVIHKQHPDPDSTVKIQNPQVLKVIAILLRNSPQCTETLEVRRAFLSDMIKLFNNSRENRRSLLQCSVWQEWMLSLCCFNPKTSEEQKITEMVYAIFRILLYHAIKYEWGGWRVWVDTLSITHSKVTFEMHKENLSQMYREYQGKEGEGSGIGPSAPIRTISGVSKEAETVGKLPHLELKEAAAAPSCIVDDDMECSTEKNETKPSSVGDQQTHSVSNQGKELEEEDRESAHNLTAVPCSEFSPETEAIKPSVSEISTGIAEAIEDSLSKAHELVQEKAAVTAASLAEQTTLEGETLESPEGLEKSTLDAEEEDDFVDLKEESSMPLPLEEVAETVKEHSSHESQGIKQEKVIEKEPESVLLESKDTGGVDGKKLEMASLSETVSSAVQEIATRMDSEGEKKLEEENILFSETRTAEEDANARVPELAGASEKRIAKLDVSSVASDTERLELKKLITRAPGFFVYKLCIQTSRQQDSLGQELAATSDGQRRDSRSTVFRIPEFKWSLMHQRLLTDLLFSIETDIQMWRSHSTKTVMDFVNSSDNVIFVHNTIHLISQVMDNMIMACGGILPLLSAATSATHELENIEPTQGLSVEASLTFLQRLINLVDVLIFASSLGFTEIESEKNMSSGGILRQCLRLVCAVAVRNCLECQQHAQLKPTGDTVKNQKTMQGLIGTGKSASPVDIVTGGISPIRDHDRLLQDMDINRLRAVVFRDIEDSKQAQFLALAVVYFISVLMVSKYRDILEPQNERRPPNHSQSFKASENGSNETTAPATVVENPSTALGASSSASNDDSESTASVRRRDSGLGEEPASGQTNSSDGVAEEEPLNISAGPDAISEVLCTLSLEVNKSQEGRSEAGTNNSKPATSVPAAKNVNVKDILRSLVRLIPDCTSQTALPKTILPATEFQQHPSDFVNHMHLFVSITDRLEHALEKAAPLLREIFVDFAPFLSRTLLGSHGQELLIEGLVCMKSSSSVVELVMLLCSQEWQNSIQKNAGLAFIELVNEGRLLSQTMKDHLVRVANEAEFILSRQRAEDIHRHAEFESLCAQYSADKREEEKMCDHLIRAAKYRDHVTATQLIQKIINILTDKHGAWGSSFWRLDYWEDDLRRRRRFVHNPLGSTHPEATLKTAGEHGQYEDVLVKGKQSIKSQVLGNQNSESEILLEGDDDTLSSIEDKDLDNFTGPVNLSAPAQLVAPSVVVKGTLSITSSEVYFEVDEEDPSFKKIDPKILAYTEGLHGKWLFSEIRSVFSRRYLLQNTALEIFMANRVAVMFNFPDQATVKKVVNCLPPVGIGTSFGLPQTRRISLASPRQIFKVSNMTQRWQHREISNFEYLMFLNTIAGRTYNDLNQYPVFPWVITNYESEELDLTLPSNFRDLSKPIGALNPKRAAFFAERYESWEDDQVPKFHYGTHYSTASFALTWLLRIEPFTTLFLNLQGGKFDHADRTFSSISRAWRNSQRDTSDIKELIPEFYYLPEIFVNSNNYSLGVMDDGTVVSDVELPPWAKTPEEFVRINRLALESEFVSCQLHQWIDLIFGYKQQGPEAVRSLNVFYYLTYEGAVNLSSITDPVLREVTPLNMQTCLCSFQAVEAQIRSFGQTPSQLLIEPHPPRSSAMQYLLLQSPLMFTDQAQQDVIMVLKFPSNSPVTHVAANTQPGLATPAVITVTANRLFAVNKWHNLPGAVQDQPYQLPVEIDPLIASNTGMHRRQITDLLDQSIQVHSQCFVITSDNRYILVCGFWDKSFRVYSTDSGKLMQVVFGHWDVVTCLARSESYIGGNCYILSGSRDATLLLWYWNGKTNIIGDNTSGDFATPRAILTGHDYEIICATVCAELGLVISGSKEGPCLIHSMNGDLLRTLEGPENCLRPKLIQASREGHCVIYYENGLFCVFSVNGKLQATMETGDNIKAIQLSRDGQYLLTGGDNGVVMVWQLWDLKQLFAYPGCDAGIRSMALSYDQRCIMTGMASGSIVVFYNDFNRWHHEYQTRY